MAAWHKVVIAIVLTTAQTAVIPAQDDRCLNRTVAVGVFAEDGRPVENIAAADFHAKFRGKPIEITAAGYDRASHRVVVLLDSSESMMNEDASLQICFVKALAASLPADYSIALLTFSDSILERVEFGLPLRAFVNRVDDMAAKYATERRGKTALNDAIEQALSMLGRPHPGESVLLVGDSGDNGSKTSPEKLKQDLLNSGVRFFAFLTVPPLLARVAGPGEVQGADVQELAVDTGGDAILFDLVETPKRMEEKARSLAIELGHFYSLQIRLPQVANKRTDWKLEVDAAGGGKKSHLRLMYPRRFTPCQPATK